MVALAQHLQTVLVYYFIITAGLARRNLPIWLPLCGLPVRLMDLY